MVIVFQQQKKKNYFTTKKPCVIREAKAKFFVTTVNQYKYNILLKLYMFLQLKI